MNERYLDEAATIVNDCNISHDMLVEVIADLLEECDHWKGVACKQQERPSEPRAIRTPHDPGQEAIDLANDIQNTCVGHSTIAVYLAISMVLGASAAHAARPDLPGLMRLIERVAREEYEQCMVTGSTLDTHTAH